VEPRLEDPLQLLQCLQELRSQVYAQGQLTFERWRSCIRRPDFLASARNLAYYLALRRHDLRPLQMALMPWGLSSLGRSESRVLASLDAVIATLGQICHFHTEGFPHHPPLEAFFQGDQLLQQQADTLLGSASPSRRVRIMVTLPPETATDQTLLRQLLTQHVECVRINCAHDSPEIWEQMIRNVRQVEAETQQPCKICMDLGGPKPRLLAVIKPHARRLFVGDQFLLSQDAPDRVSSILPFRAQCSMPEIFDQVQVGAQVWIDDGRIGTEVVEKHLEGLVLQVRHVAPKGGKLRSGYGLNFPDTVIQTSPLTPEDYQHLPFVAAHADIIGYSFVQTAQDIELLQQELQRLRGSEANAIALVAKIETQEAIRNLPEMIIQAAGLQPFGVMIARGDLAVEITYQRLAEMQEEILWICEAAHVPVIWATQVLETLAKKGIPSRAEITDAAMAERAECVMLNKGPFIVEAVRILRDVLERMQTHQLKKTPQLRALRSWIDYCHP
jgi:pyruvate kinase